VPALAAAPIATLLDHTFMDSSRVVPELAISIGKRPSAVGAGPRACPYAYHFRYPV